MNDLEFFGTNVFGDEEMKKRLSPEVYKKFKKIIKDGAELDKDIADQMAQAMKDWAVERGATHYTHWFQPLTGVTAEKHDSFLSFNSKGETILDLAGKNLIKGESDASSFPSGGLRATFEARGYTTWDCTSPAFLREDATGVTLCIPTAFCSYTGEALDKKTPLLRSIQAIDREATRLMNLLGYDKVKHVSPMVGAEQEYFLVPRETYYERKDLIYTGHTLFGAMPPKGQELDDHYYGAIREDVGAFMNDVNYELWKLGVPAKTQHNEAAPSQHELAPLYEDCNIATDHNQMTMETLKKVAERHDFVCLLHEKPFAGVNGSGKHNNWSLVTDTDINLFKPGKTPEEDMRFNIMIACVLRAIDKHADLLRQSAADVGNDLRLGANEAPPAIVSVFLGDVKKSGKKLQTGVDRLANIDLDAADRNRTSPFAFTGNKFEFRMVGSSDSISNCNVVLNTIVAETMRDVCNDIEAAIKADKSGKSKADIVKKAVDAAIADIYKKHSRIIFDGNGYSDAWVKEAVRRGLPNYPSMIDAIPALVTPKAVKLFESFGVFTKAELVSRAEIEYEAYVKEINIEARTMIDIAAKHIIPAVASYLGKLAGSSIAVKTAVPGADTMAQDNMIDEISRLLGSASKSLDKLSKDVNKAAKVKGACEAAHYYRDKVVPAMKALRTPVDKLEMLVGKDDWPMPSYGDLLFR